MKPDHTHHTHPTNGRPADGRHAGETRSVAMIVLPSGHAVQVIGHAGSETCDHELYDCPACGSDLVEPTAWAQAPEGRWSLALRCPNCGRSESGTFSTDQVERLESHLDTGLAGMITDLQQLARANMAADAELFLNALHAGYVLPEDF